MADAVKERVERVVAAWGHAMGTDSMVTIESGGHFSAADPVPAVGMRLEMLEALVEAGLRTTHPFTLDPRGPIDLSGMRLSQNERDVFVAEAADVPRYHELMVALGLRDDYAYTCTPYLPEVGNIPHRGQVLSWSESSCIIYANSVLGACVNRTPAIVDLFTNLLGYTPEFGLLTEEGRQAGWLVELETRKLPEPQVLGAFIATNVVAAVPYIVGLDDHLEAGSSARSRDYLKEMGAACAAVGGAVGLMHVEGLTPEAVDEGRRLLRPDHRTLPVRQDDLDRLWGSYRAAQRADAAPPQRCVIGCPHLSVPELEWWVGAIEDRLASVGRAEVAIETILAAAPQVIERFLARGDWSERARAVGIVLTPACLETFMDNPACALRPTVTTSNKLRAYTTARLAGDDELLDIVAGRGGGSL